MLLITNCATNLLFGVITWAYHLLYEYQRHKQSSKLSTKPCPNEKKTRPLCHEFSIVSIFIHYSLFISNYLLKLCSFNYWNPAGWNISSWALSSFELFFLREVFNDFSCCSCKSLSLTLDNVRLSLWNLSTNLTPVQLYANFQEGKMHCLHGEKIQHSFCYLLIAFILNVFKTVLNRTRCLQKFSLIAVQMKLSSSLSPDSFYH